MAAVKLNIKIDKSMEPRFDQIIAAVKPPSLTSSAGQGADVIKERMRDYTPVQTGYLAASIDKQLSGATEYEIGPSLAFEVEYAAHQNFGGPSIGDYYMAFDWQGRQFYIHEVDIPGTEYVAKGFAAGAEEAKAKTIESVRADMGI